MQYMHAIFIFDIRMLYIPEAERSGAIRPIYEVVHRYFASERYGNF